MNKIKLSIYLIFITFLFFSCHKTDTLENTEKQAQINTFILDGVIYKIPTETELAELKRNGIYLDCDSRSHDCKWSDNQGSISCVGGTCGIIQTQNPNNSWSACIGCYIAEELDHAGACRNM